MKTFTNFILGLVLTLTVTAFLINAEVACAILAALGVLAIAVNDYGPWRYTHSRLAV